MTRPNRRLLAGLLFASPFLIGFAVFTLYPLLASFYYSFCDYNVFDPPVFTGTKNYAELLSDTLFRKACWNTLVFTVFSVPVTMLVALGLAMLLNLKVRGLAFYRVAFFLPSIVPLVAASVLWIWVFNPQFGILNVCIRAIKPFIDPFFTLPVPGWLTDPAWAKTALIIMSVWGAGSNMVLYLAGLQEVPREQYEAAEIDGANAWRRTWHITLPSISPTLFFTLIMGFIGTLQYFTQAFVMTSGGPADATLFYSLYLFNNAFTYFRMGYASAMAYVLFVVIVLCTIFLFRGSRRFVHYQ
jgi:multiple sugar transport system permease protein